MWSSAFVVHNKSKGGYQISKRQITAHVNGK